MKNSKFKQIFLVLIVFLFLNSLLFVILIFLKDNISFFYTVSDALALPVNQQKLIRIGGMVVENSIVRNENEIIFQITDFSKKVIIKYRGILPPMFLERSGVVVQGKMLDDMSFIAEKVFAKHDENYMARKNE